MDKIEVFDYVNKYFRLQNLFNSGWLRYRDFAYMITYLLPDFTYIQKRRLFNKFITNNHIEIKKVKKVNMYRYNPYKKKEDDKKLGLVIF